MVCFCLVTVLYLLNSISINLFVLQVSLHKINIYMASNIVGLPQSEGHHLPAHHGHGDRLAEAGELPDHGTRQGAGWHCRAGHHRHRGPEEPAGPPRRDHCGLRLLEVSTG